MTTIDYENPWEYNGSPFTSDQIDEYIGFVYLITNKQTTKFYIGKKNFLKKTYSRKGGKKKRKLVESDWKKYYSSSEELQGDVKLLGEHNFNRKILLLCKTKSELTYYEAKFQFDKNVLTERNNYNAWIMCRVRKSHLLK
jgi:hypothetical protein